MLKNVYFGLMVKSSKGLEKEQFFLYFKLLKTYFQIKVFFMIKYRPTFIEDVINVLKNEGKKRYFKKYLHF